MATRLSESLIAMGIELVIRKHLTGQYPAMRKTAEGKRVALLISQSLMLDAQLSLYEQQTEILIMGVALEIL